MCECAWESVSVGMCVPVCAHAGGGATLKDAVDLPLGGIRRQWISPYRPLRPPVTTTPFTSGGATAAGAPHSVSVSVFPGPPWCPAQRKHQRVE